MIKVFLQDEEEFDILSDEDTKELLVQLIVRADGKSEEFARNTIDWWYFNFQITHFGYEICWHSFGNWKIKLQAIKETENDSIF